MKRTVELQTSEGNSVRILLENWGSGLDGTRRRWTLGDGYWQCMDSAEIAQESGVRGLKASAQPALQPSEPPKGGNRLYQILVNMRGQTMAEYALIIAAVWGAYDLMAHHI